MFTPTSIEPASIAFNLISTFLCFLCFLCFSSHSSFHFWGANLATCLGSLRGGGYLARRVLGSSDSLHMQINDKLRCVFCSAALMSWMRERERRRKRVREKLKLGARIYFSVLRLVSASTAALIMGTQFGLRAASLKYWRDSSGRLSRPLDFVFKINC